MLRILISLLLYISGGITFTVGTILLLIISLVSRKLMFLYIPVFCHSLMFSMGVIIKKTGKFPEGGPFIIMSNHGSFIDTFVVPPSIDGEYTAIVASKNFKIPLFSSLLKKLKAVKIIRGNKKAAIKSIKYAEKVIHTDKCHMVILPEGTRTLNGDLQQFKKGGFYMALNTNTPILLIAHKNTHLYKPKNRWTLSPRTIDVIIGPVINTDEYSIDNINELINKTWNEMNNLLTS